MPAFMDSLDIANRALDHLGLPHILDVNEDSPRNAVMAAAYDKLREAELERNVWTFAKRKIWLRPINSASRLLSPDLWDANTVYLPGSIVSDANGDLWISWQADNYGNQPGVSNVWDSYYGPLAINAYDSTVTYNAGELVYKLISAPNGAFAVYMSMASGNTSTPDVTEAWDSTKTYGLNDRVSYSGSTWRSIITLNNNITPAAPPSPWVSSTTYSTNNTVLGSDGIVYTSVGNGNVGNDPTTDGGVHWTRGSAAAWKADNNLQFSASNNWMPLYANLTNIPTEWQYTAPSAVVTGSALNVFRFPSQAMRRAKVGYRFHGFPDDYEPHGDYITSADAIILVEFVFNVRDVRKMHPMFCEGLACRLAASTCKRLTGSEQLTVEILAEYQKFMVEARAVNGIEAGPEEPDEDEYITVRTGGPGGYTSGATNWWN